MPNFCLGLLEIAKTDLRFDNIEKYYKYKNLKEVALFEKFVHEYIYKKDEERARKTSDKLDKEYLSSKYAYQAHLIMGDENYTIDGLKALMEDNNKKLSKQELFSQKMTLQVPTEYKLYQNYPNPFNPSTIIKYQLPENTFVKLNVYNSMGQLIKTLVNDIRAAGTYSIEWHSDNDFGCNVSSGIYFYCLITNNNVFTNKMVLVR